MKWPDGGAAHVGALVLEPATATSAGDVIPFLKPVAQPRDLSEHPGVVCGLEFSPDGKLLLATNRGSSSFGVLDPSSRKWLWSRVQPSQGPKYRTIGFRKGSTEVLYLELESRLGDFEGDWAAATHRTRLVACEAASGRKIREHTQVFGRGEWPMRLLLLPDGETLACITKVGDANSTGGDEAKLLLMQANSGRRLRSAEIDAVPNELACAPDGETLATLETDGSVRLWSPGLQSLGRLPGVAGSRGFTRLEPDGHWLAFSPDGHRLAGLSRDHVAIWDVPRRKLIRSFPNAGQFGVADLSFSPDGTKLAVASSKGNLTLWPLP